MDSPAPSFAVWKTFPTVSAAINCFCDIPNYISYYVKGLDKEIPIAKVFNLINQSDLFATHGLTLDPEAALCMGSYLSNDGLFSLFWFLIPDSTVIFAG